MADVHGVRRWVPPRPALAVAAFVVGIVMVIAATAWMVGGEGLAMSSALGAVSVIALAARRPSWPHLLWFGVVLAGCGAGAVATEDPRAVGALVALSVLAVTPIAVRYGPVVAIVPVVIADLAVGADRIDPGAALAGVLVGALVCAAAMRALPMPAAPAAGRAPSGMGAYLAILAFLAGITTGIIVAYDLPHGVWIVIALAMVWVPDAGETMPRARARIAGTVVGAAAGAVAATMLPVPAALAGAGVALLLSVALMFAGRRREFVASTAFAVVVVVSVGGGEGAWDAGFSRVWLTALGAAVAVGAGVVVARLEGSRQRRA
ncbi:FUSC family protein [Demequina muriae]|uniref:FUSC family protein n=1 Tax=Demequina muriae TaxID=3051664 RepID=A0ABT8GI33_9MICO|nr:FUSC family protein [Demequina sp. EGI L300058]MDN4481098.1 FUSC family protein [Demequina sp. EGI L300058]